MLCHWDDVPWTAHEHGDLRCDRQRLGAGAGARDVGLSRYPDSSKVALRGLRVIARVERLDYRDGEE